VVTDVNGFAGGIDAHASLTCLFVVAKLGPAQQIKQIARPRKRLPIVLDSQADAIQALLPVLAGPERERLLLECHGR
jgi:hypothetical protein